MVSSMVADPSARTDSRQALGEFCRAVARIVQGSPEKESPARVAALLPALLSEPALLTEAQMAAPAEGYGRHKLFLCPEGRFSVLAMVWPAGEATPIHDHRNWCAFGVYRGVVEETRYRPLATGRGTATAAPVSRVRHRVGDVGHLPVDAPDIHRMHNPAATTAVSIHVYGGDFDRLGPNLGRIYAVEG